MSTAGYAIMHDFVLRGPDLNPLTDSTPICSGLNTQKNYELVAAKCVPDEIKGKIDFFDH